MITIQDQPAPTSPRLKWHMLRRRKSDAAFQRENLASALYSGAACEVDIVLTADSHALCSVSYTHLTLPTILRV